MTLDARPPDVITVGGHDLVGELIGRWSFTEMIQLLMTDGVPDPGHTAVIDALLVTFADHGVTPSSMAARLTLLGAPEAFQAAVAAGLCGAGSVFLGTLEDAAALLGEAVSGWPGTAPEILADQVVAQLRGAGQQVVGLGHPEHKHGDPRVPRLLDIAGENGVRGAHTALLLALPAALQRFGGPLLPVNAAGLGGALVADMGHGASFARGIAVIARAAGLVGQLLEEQQRPVARAMWDRERTSPTPSTLAPADAGRSEHRHDR